MKRLIEDLVEQRKNQQAQLKQTLERLAGQMRIPFRRRRNRLLEETMGALHNNITELMTTQDREWDAYSCNHSTTVFKSLQWKIEKLESEYSAMNHLLVSFVQLERSLHHLIEAIDAHTPRQTVETLKSLHDRLSPLQYSGFEGRFRGTEEAIRFKLKKYLPHFPPPGPVLDFGCGRGEFLQLLQLTGVEATGIDLSESMLTLAREKGLKVHAGDVLEFLHQKPDATFTGIFSAQVIEHFAADYLQQTVSESFRALKPGGAIILETINPLSLFALSRIYFLDPSHSHPLHPEYMRFLLEQTGFLEVEIIFGESPESEKLQALPANSPEARILNTNIDIVNEHLFAPSEFAVKGKKG